MRFHLGRFLVAVALIVWCALSLPRPWNYVVFFVVLVGTQIYGAWRDVRRMRRE